MAIQKEDKPIEKFLRGNGATLGTEEMDVRTTEDILEWLKRMSLLPSMFPVFLHNLRTWNVTAEMLFTADDPEAIAKLLHPDLNESWSNAFFKLILYQSALQRTRALGEELKAAKEGAAATADASGMAEAAQTDGVAEPKSAPDESEGSKQTEDDSSKSSPAGSK
jgi:hypothetical protein